MEAAVGFSSLGNLRVLLGSAPDVRRRGRRAQGLQPGAGEGI